MRHTLLIVDDEPNILRSLERLFMEDQYEVITASSPERALQCVGNRRDISLVITDQRMPGMTGSELLAQIRAKIPDAVRIMLTGHADINAVVEAINAGHVYKYITKPWNDEDMKVTVLRALEQYELLLENRRLTELTRQQNEKLRLWNAALETKVQERTTEIEQKNRELEQTFVETIRAFARLQEIRAASMGSHSKRVAIASKFVATEMALPPDEVRTIEVAAILHDIGKIGLNDCSLGKQQFILDREHRELYGKHPVIGQESIDLVKSLQEPAKLIRSHHERFNGTGFPDGLKGDEIPLGSRIIAVANDFDAITCTTGGKRALQEVTKERGAFYDPDVVDVFLTYLSYLQTRQEELVKVRLPVSELLSGNVLARDLVTKYGVMLLPRDETLTAEHVAKIREYVRKGALDDAIYVYLPRKEASAHRPKVSTSEDEQDET